MTRVRHILYGSDFSRASARALAAAVVLARATRARMTIVHVLAPVVPLIPEHHLGTQIELLRGRVRQWTEHRIARRSVQAEGRLLEGDSVEQILREARSDRPQPAIRQAPRLAPQARR